MIKKLVLLVFLIFLIGCTFNTDESALKFPAQDIEDQEKVNIELPDKDIQEIAVDESPNEIIGPAGCIGEQCDEYFKDNPEESQKWCDDNPEPCSKLKTDFQGTIEGPGNCGNDCERFCDENEEQCQEWCSVNSAKNPELCGLMAMGEEREPRQGDGVWEKEELTFYIKDGENVLTQKKKEVMRGTITSEQKIGKAFLGWNAALEELNKMYPDNIVPDRMVEIESETDADFVIEVHSEKEYCCDLAGLPVKGIERSTIDDNFAKIRSDVNIYNIVNMDIGFLEDVTMHELGHGLGLFGHVTDRPNDLMSLISPGRGIKEGNLNDLYVKYRDRIIESVEETRERDESVRDDIVSAPD